MANPYVLPASKRPRRRRSLSVERTVIPAIPYAGPTVSGQLMTQPNAILDQIGQFFAARDFQTFATTHRRLSTSAQRLQDIVQRRLRELQDFENAADLSPSTERLLVILHYDNNRFHMGLPNTLNSTSTPYTPEEEAKLPNGHLVVLGAVNSQFRSTLQYALNQISLWRNTVKTLGVPNKITIMRIPGDVLGNMSVRIPLWPIRKQAQYHYFAADFILDDQLYRAMRAEPALAGKAKFELALLQVPGLLQHFSENVWFDRHQPHNRLAGQQGTNLFFTPNQPLLDYTTTLPPRYSLVFEPAKFPDGPAIRAWYEGGSFADWE